MCAKSICSVKLVWRNKGKHRKQREKTAFKYMKMEGKKQNLEEKQNLDPTFHSRQIWVQYSAFGMWWNGRLASWVRSWQICQYGPKSMRNVSSTLLTLCPQSQNRKCFSRNSFKYMHLWTSVFKTRNVNVCVRNAFWFVWISVSMHSIWDCPDLPP